MNATFWLVIAVVCFVLAGIFLILAAFIFFGMKIPSVIDDLTGKTVVREVHSIKEKNYQSKTFSAVPDQQNQQMKNTGNMTKTLDISVNSSQSYSGRNYQATADLNEQPSERIKAPVETMVLNPPVVQEEKNQEEFFEIVRKIVVIHTQEIIV